MPSIKSCLINVFSEVTFIEAQYDKVSLFKVYSSMNFDKRMWLHNHHFNQDVEHFHRPQKFPPALVVKCGIYERNDL